MANIFLRTAKIICEQKPGGVAGHEHEHDVQQDGGQVHLQCDAIRWEQLLRRCRLGQLYLGIQE